MACAGNDHQYLLAVYLAHKEILGLKAIQVLLQTILNPHVRLPVGLPKKPGMVAFPPASTHVSVHPLVSKKLNRRYVASAHSYPSTGATASAACWPPFGHSAKHLLCSGSRRRDLRSFSTTLSTLFCSPIEFSLPRNTIVSNCFLWLCTPSTFHVPKLTSSLPSPQW